MATKFDMIAAANRLHRELTEQSANIIANIAVLAEEAQVTPQVMTESVTHILANIRQTIMSGKPLQLMHSNSLAAFLAGLEAIAKALPGASDEQKKQNTLRTLAVAAIGTDGHINGATVPVVNLGARKPDLVQKYEQLLRPYLIDQSGGQQLLGAVGRLQQQVDMAMRTAMHAKA